MTPPVWQAGVMRASFLRLPLSCALLLASAPAMAPARAAAPAALLPATGFADLAARLLPAVVNIAVSETVKPGEPDADDPDDGPNGDGPDAGPNGQSPFPPGSPFEKFFHDFMNRQHPGLDPNGPHPKGRRMHALGSGFIIDPSGIIVTNNHVIKDADEITVTLQDNTELKATIVGHDPNTDLAVLRVKPARPLPSVPFGDSDHMRVGDLVMAIGNPFGLSGTVTTGIVSSRGRDIHQGQYDDFIQTDAAINRGNSGGPLLNMAGEVIGVNTAIYSPGGGSIGIGFAIPSNEVKLVTDQLLKYGHTKRGWIGVRVQDLTHDLADTMKVSATQGALIAGVEANGPAQKGGLKRGDIVLTYGGKPVDGHSLPRLVAETPSGQTGEFGILRDGKPQTVKLTIGEFPQPPEPAKTGAKDKPASKSPAPSKTPPAPKTPATTLGDTGLKYGPLDPATRAAAHLDATTTGIAVLDVTPDSPADDHGLSKGDVITQIDQAPIASPEAFAAAIATARKSGRQSVLLLVQNADGQQFIPLPLGGS